MYRHNKYMREHVKYALARSSSSNAVFLHLPVHLISGQEAEADPDLDSFEILNRYRNRQLHHFLYFILRQSNNSAIELRL